MFNLFITFFKIGLFTFGGGYAMIPLISEELSQFNIDQYTFSNFIAIAESTPGPFAINIATFIGYSTYNILGAIVASFGVILPSFLIILFISVFINKFKNTLFFKTFIKISTPIVLGLILSATFEISLLNLFNVSTFTSIQKDFNFNWITIITFSILLILSLIYYIKKKRKPSPFTIISLSIIIGFVSYLVTYI